jgi:4-hydroxy-tetrahydrodipicolinate reductase
MGKVSCEAISAASDMDLVGTVNRGDSLPEVLKKHKPDAVVEFTTPESVFQNTKCIIEAGISPVVGATGLSTQQMTELRALCDQQGLGAIIAPNFSLGAIVTMQAAKQIAAHFPQAEIIEMHHDQKIDSPSGTALKTAEMMAEAGPRESPPFAEQRARGEVVHGTAIHSVRLPGLFAHQLIVFGSEGETLTIRHDSTDRRAMMPGLLLALRQVQKLNTLVYGLDQLL